MEQAFVHRPSFPARLRVLMIVHLFALHRLCVALLHSFFVPRRSFPVLLCSADLFVPDPAYPVPAFADPFPAALYFVAAVLAFAFPDSFFPAPTVSAGPLAFRCQG